MDETTFRPVRTDSAKEEIIAQLETRILQGEIPPGHRLPPERELASALGVSRPLVHDALGSLAERGLVLIRPRHGVVVNDFRISGTLNLLVSLINRNDHLSSRELIGDLESFRLNMEKEMIRLACRNRKKEDLNELEKLLEEERQLPSGADSVKLADLDFRFHLRLALAGGNAIYALLMNTLKPVHMDILGRFFQTPGVAAQVHRIHGMMVESLRNRDEETASLLIEKNDSYGSYS